mmetsp:Transcript_5276/g.5776  ORF Transcript_5276/g.5776 Transcript_5276/m.5776 type:complete len:150 (-) Transcript_5276:669-1118(-)
MNQFNWNFQSLHAGEIVVTVAYVFKDCESVAFEAFTSFEVPTGLSIRPIAEEIRNEFPIFLKNLFPGFDGVVSTDSILTMKDDKMFYCLKWMKERAVPLKNSPTLRPLECKYRKGVNKGFPMIQYLHRRLKLIPSQVSSNSYTFLLLAW